MNKKLLILILLATSLSIPCSTYPTFKTTLTQKISKAYPYLAAYFVSKPLYSAYIAPKLTKIAVNQLIQQSSHNAEWTNFCNKIILPKTPQDYLTTVNIYTNNTITQPIMVNSTLFIPIKTVKEAASSNEKNSELKALLEKFTVYARNSITPTTQKLAIPLTVLRGTYTFLLNRYAHDTAAWKKTASFIAYSVIESMLGTACDFYRQAKKQNLI